MNAVPKDAQLAISAPTHNILDVPDEVWQYHYMNYNEYFLNPSKL